MGYTPMGSNAPIGVVTASTPTNVSVTNSSTQIVAANLARRFILLSNIGVKDVFISGDGTALDQKGVLLAKGGILILGGSIDITTSLHGITSAGSTTIAIQEFT